MYSPHGFVIEGSGTTHTHMASGIFWPLDEIPQQSLVHVASQAVPALARLREDVLHLEPDAQQTHVTTPAPASPAANRWSPARHRATETFAQKRLVCPARSATGCPPLVG